MLPTEFLGTMNKYKIKKEQGASNEIPAAEKPFVKMNYLMMGGCILLIVLGFLLMAGGGSGDGGFNPDIFSTRRIVVGPALAFLGFLLMAFAILYSPRSKQAPSEIENGDK